MLNGGDASHSIVHRCRPESLGKQEVTRCGGFRTQGQFGHRQQGFQITQGGDDGQAASMGEGEACLAVTHRSVRGDPFPH